MIKSSTPAKSRKVKKGQLHSRNPHQGRYDLALLSQANPALAAFIVPNPSGEPTVDFSDPAAVLNLNKALLAHYYKVKQWEIPAGYLCPPIPGRADHLHYLADLLADGGEVPSGKSVKVLDIGVGANCIYPIIGSQTFGWKFVGTDTDLVAINVANVIVQSNRCLQKNVILYHQPDSKRIFDGMIQKDDYFALTMCNPPFHASAAEAQASNARKVQNLSKAKPADPVAVTAASKLNFGGQQAELWYEGGEFAFISQMIKESVKYASQVGWFSSLVSKSENVQPLTALIERSGAQAVKIIPMAQGQKTSRMIAWHF